MEKTKHRQEDGYGRVRIDGRAVILLALLLLLFLIGWLVEREERPSEFVVACTTYDQVRPGQIVANTTSYLLDGQVIITGPESKVDDAIMAARDRVVSLEQPDLATDCDLSFLARLPAAPEFDVENFPFPPEVRDELVLRLYRFEQDDAGRPTVAEVVEAINEQGNPDFVFADPNLLTGLLGQSACADPNSVGPSPFEVNANPNSVGPSPFKNVSGSAAAAEFWEQWPLEHIGLTRSMEGTLAAISSRPTGAGVRVAVFDTSPFPFDDLPSPSDGGVTSTSLIDTTEPVPWMTSSGVNQTLILTVSYPVMANTLAAPGASSGSGTLTATATISNVREHGLFVAGLVHAVAPESDIQLVRVLNEYGCGDLQTLNEGLIQFLVQMLNERNSLQGAVLNLSLGVERPQPSEIAGDESAPAAQQPSAVSLAASETMTELLNLHNDRPTSLRTVLYLAQQNGAVIVAAAGNDTYSEPGNRPVAPQMPAEFPFVIGVTASNADRDLACFSNWGDVAAPGGDGGPNHNADGTLITECGPVNAECDGPCDEALISLVTMPPRVTGPTADTTASHAPPYYAYWSGSSFATPLVSGLAALVLDAGTFGPKSEIANEVLDAIHCGATTPDGVINVPATLFRCLP